MLNVLLRGLIYITLQILFIPIKVLALLWIMVYTPYLAIKGYFTIKESVEILLDSMKRTVMAELNWIKTGELEL